MSVQGLGQATDISMTLNEAQKTTLSTVFQTFLDPQMPTPERANFYQQHVTAYQMQLNAHGLRRFFAQVKIILLHVATFLTRAQARENTKHAQATQHRMQVIQRRVNAAINTLETALEVQKLATYTFGTAKAFERLPETSQVTLTFTDDQAKGKALLPPAIDEAVRVVVDITNGNIFDVSALLKQLDSEAISPAEKRNINTLLASLIEKSVERKLEIELAEADEIPPEDVVYRMFKDSLAEMGYGLPSAKTGEMIQFDMEDLSPQQEAHVQELFKNLSLDPSRHRIREDEDPSLERDLFVRAIDTPHLMIRIPSLSKEEEVSLSPNESSLSSDPVKDSSPSATALLFGVQLPPFFGEDIYLKNITPEELARRNAEASEFEKKRGSCAGKELSAHNRIRAVETFELDSSPSATALLFGNQLPPFFGEDIYLKNITPEELAQRNAEADLFELKRLSYTAVGLTSHGPARSVEPFESESLSPASEDEEIPGASLRALRSAFRSPSSASGKSLRWKDEEHLADFFEIPKVRPAEEKEDVILNPNPLSIAERKEQYYAEQDEIAAIEAKVKRDPTVQLTSYEANVLKAGSRDLRRRWRRSQA